MIKQRSLREKIKELYFRIKDYLGYRPQIEDLYAGEYIPPVRETRQKIKRRKMPHKCEGECSNILTTTTSFYCADCKRWHCEEHRLPENHACKGKPKAPAGAYRGVLERGEWKVYGK